VRSKRLSAALLSVPLALAAVVGTGSVAQSQVPRQSPVDVVRSAVDVDRARPELRVSYGRSELELAYVRKDQDSPGGCTARHHEETEEARVPAGAAQVTVAGVRYELEQFHFHTPSEHRFGGHSFPLEMHLVHRSAAGELLVIGVPLRPGPHSTVDDVLARLSPECGDPVRIPTIDLASLLPANHGTIRYQGSLTTAPFTEGVRWFLMADRTVTHATITRFQTLFVHGNSRATQPLNGRRLTAVPQR
jgi:carbonic anhydrase